MVYAVKSNYTSRILWTVLTLVLLLSYGTFFRTLGRTWLNDPEFSYGVLIPVIVAYLIWTRRHQLNCEKKTSWPAGLAIVFAGCSLQVLGSLSGTLLLLAFAFVVSLLGITGFLLGRQCLRIIAGPLAFLILMVPLPSYVMGQLSWYLQATASTLSTAILRFLSLPVYQDGNLLRLPNYVLEVKQACSGSNSILALVALALLLGLSVQGKWWIRTLLLTAAPVLAVGTNIFRIVGTGLIARQWGELAANESLHTAWGILAFVIGVMGLLGFQGLLRWAANEHA